MSEQTPNGKPVWRRRIAFGLAGVLLLLVLAGAAVAIWLRGQVEASLPQLDGERTVAGLRDEVVVERDSLGVPTIRASNRLDLARATGFVHAQDRFFQMDLLRRQSAGELAEMFGANALSIDRRMRLHRFRTLAGKLVDDSPAHVRELLAAYVEGVNTGLESLRARPPEYLALRMKPVPWRPEDSLLVLFSMYTDLQPDNPRRESARGLLYDLMPELYEYLAPRGTEWDAPIDGTSVDVPELPGPDVFDTRGEAPAAAARLGRPTEATPVTITGSNNWAVSGRLTADGRALMANDMHLPHGLPNIWYRASLVWSDGAESHRVTGVTLPGMPWVAAGSNGHIAWGFTNSQGDWADLVIIEPDPEDETRYLTPDGPGPFEHHEEIIRVRDGDDETVDVRWTRWGPIVDRDHRDRPRALRWVAHDLGTVEPAFGELEGARDVDQAVEIANRSTMPTQNFVVADSSGRIAWTLMGPMPRRVGFEGRIPRSWADGNRRWDGRLTPEEYPRIVDPASGRLWTANNRVVGGEMLQKIGDGGYDIGARAGQIRDDLRALDAATVEDLLAIQLDDRALFLERWRELLLATLTDAAVTADPRRAELRSLVAEDWSGRASVESSGYRFVRGFRLFLAQQLFEALTRPCKEADEQFNFLLVGQWERPLWQLVQERPGHLLPARFESWDAQLLAAVDELLDYYLEQGAALGERTWGERNTVRVQHPISLAVPQLSEWLDIPPEPLPGDSNMPRVQGPRHGASERFVVSPGLEEQGFLHMPGGQSGHPLAPYYRTGHRAWAEGDPTPFLPGTPVHHLTLQP